MPLLTLNTNRSLDEAERQDLLNSLSEHTAKILGKPESYVMVQIADQQTMSFGGDSAPCAYLQLKSLGLPEQRTAEFSAQLCQLVEQELAIPTDRIYIEFSSPARHLWGWDTRTFG